MTRTDLHRPGALIPVDYRCVACFSFPTGPEGIDPEGYMDEYQEWSNTHPDSELTKHDNGGCAICGTHYRHGAIMLHIPTGDFIEIGHRCASTHALALSDTGFQRALKKQRKLRQVEITRARKAAKRADFLAEHPGLEVALQGDHYITRDMAAKFQRYLALSDKQIALAMKLAAEEPERKEAERQTDCPEGRIEVEGEVVGLGRKDTDWGSARYTMTVEVTTDAGTFRIWGTQPTSLDDAARGSRVRFTATIARSSDDHSFGFFKRPARAVVMGAK